MGTECRKILNNLPEVTEETRKKPDPIIKALRTYFLPQRNVLYERFLFNSAVQKAGETVDQFVLRLRQLADTCEFDTLKDSLIRDRLVIGTKDEAGRERLRLWSKSPNDLGLGSLLRYQTRQWVQNNRYRRANALGCKQPNGT